MTTRPNNPYLRGADQYDRRLSRPIIRSMRETERQAVEALLTPRLEGCCRVLEIGPGTGWYTALVARCCPEVEVVEQAPAMVELLHARLSREQLTNVTVWTGDFLDQEFSQPFDLVLSVGVLDYIAEPRQFLARMVELARRSVVFTVPRRGMWGRCFQLGGALTKTRVFCYHPREVADLLPQPPTEVVECGLRTAVTKGLTLAVAVDRG